MTNITPAPEHIDHRRGIDHIGVTVAAIIHDGKGHILLQKRGPKARDEQGNWDLTGGALEFGEPLEDAIRREVHEELCAEAYDIRFLTAYDVRRVQNGIHTHWICILHAARVNPGEVKIGEPHKTAEIDWFTADNIPTPPHSQLHKALEHAVAHKLI